MKSKILFGWVISVFFFCAIQLSAIAAPEISPSDANLAPSLSSSPNLTNGAQVFEAQCAGCHVGGGNIIRRGKNLKLKTLQKNHVETIAAIAALVTAGKGNMSAYGNRITAIEINDVSAYVLNQAEQNWK
jgi:cytochrome c6